MRNRWILVALSLGLLGADYPMAEGYRLHLSATEWVDVCCLYADVPGQWSGSFVNLPQGRHEPCWQDVSPITRVEVEKQTNITTRLWIEKERSIWRLERNLLNWDLELVKPYRIGLCDE